jgi:hypothetical protein
MKQNQENNDMNIIKFSHNWNNKLNNKVFTTIRRDWPAKLDYYRRATNSIFQICLKGEYHSQAQLDSVKPIRFSMIPHALLATDTGTSFYTAIFDKFGIRGDDKVLILTFTDNDLKDTGIRKDPELSKGRRSATSGAPSFISAWYGSGCLLTDQPVPDVTQDLDVDSGAFYGGRHFVCETVTKSAAQAIAIAMGWIWIEKKR